MAKRRSIDRELTELSDEELGKIPLAELQRIRNKRWAHKAVGLVERADQELLRRSPKVNWKCLRCGRPDFHEKEMRVSGGFLQSFLGWETSKYHAIICNYCGKTEFYSVLMPGSQQVMGMLGD